MKDQNYYLNQLATLTETGSDYAIAKLLGISRQRISNYRSGFRVMDDMVRVKTAQLLGVDVLEIIAALNMQRAKTDEKKAFWNKVAGTAASVILALTIMTGLSSSSTSYAFSKTGNNIYYAHKTANRMFTRSVGDVTRHIDGIHGIAFN